MGNLGFVFGIIGMSLGISGFVFSIISMNKVTKLEEKLETLNVIN